MSAIAVEAFIFLADAAHFSGGHFDFCGRHLCGRHFDQDVFAVERIDQP